MKKIYLAFLLIFLTTSLKAQKIPDIQANPLTAPINIKIDGKAGEWGETFAADNKRTSLLYSLANDDKNLYLVIKGIGAGNIDKIMAGGITFTINTSGKKKEEGSASITYPLVKRTARGQGGGRQVMAQVAGGTQGRGGFGGGGAQNRPQLTTAQRDSASLVNHKNQMATVKEIKVMGFKTVTDTLISIYNEHSIKAVASFDATGAMIYELAVPLSLLELSTDKPKEFAYQLKINGLQMNGFGGGGNGGNGGRMIMASPARGGNFGGGGNSTLQEMMSPTDFWGKYTLIKK